MVRNDTAKNGNGAGINQAQLGFEAKHKALLAEDAENGQAASEDKNEYLADNVFWVPKEARWST